jgi:hypothetical protein
VGHHSLYPTDEEDKKFQNMIHEAASSQTYPDTDGFDSTIAHACLHTVSVLQKLISFLGGQDSREISELDYLPSSKDQLSRQISSLFLRLCKDEDQESQDFYRKYEDAFVTGYGVVCIYSESLLNPEGVDDQTWHTISRLAGMIRFYVMSMAAMSMRRSVFQTHSGLIGLSPNTIEKGDCVVIIPGAGVPCIVRPVELDVYTILGEAYVPGIMYGELFGGEQTPESTWMEFC